MVRRNFPSKSRGPGIKLPRFDKKLGDPSIPPVVALLGSVGASQHTLDYAVEGFLSPGSHVRSRVTGDTLVAKAVRLGRETAVSYPKQYAFYRKQHLDFVKGQHRFLLSNPEKVVWPDVCPGMGHPIDPLSPAEHRWMSFHPESLLVEGHCAIVGVPFFRRLMKLAASGESDAIEGVRDDLQVAGVVF